MTLAKYSSFTYFREEISKMCLFFFFAVIQFACLLGLSNIFIANSFISGSF